MKKKIITVKLPNRELIETDYLPSIGEYLIISGIIYKVSKISHYYEMVIKGKFARITTLVTVE